MRRDVRIEIRLSAEERARWQEAADSSVAEGNLSNFIRATVNTSLRQSPTVAQPVPPSEWPVHESVPQEDRQTAVAITEAITLGASPASKAEAPTCSNAPFHMRGRYCKFCQEVIQ